MPFPSSRPANPPASQPAQQPPAQRTWGAAAAQQPAQQATPSQPAQQPVQQQPAAQGGWGNRPQSQTQVAKSPFAGVENAEVYQRNAYIGEGDYLLKILSVVLKDGRNRRMIIIEGDVLVSNYDPQTAPQANREGTRVSSFIIDGDNFLSNLKEFIIAASGFDASGNPRPLDDVVTAEECEQVCGPDNPLAGAIIYTKARVVPTKQGNPFTRMAYHPAVIGADGTPDVQKCVELYGA